MIDLPEKQYQFVRVMSPRDVFEIWRGNEESREQWESHVRECGFSSWEEWRGQYARAFRLREREWLLYRVLNPADVIPKWHGGPFKTWMERHYGGVFTPTFDQLAQRQDMRQHAGLQQLKDDFPPETTVTALYMDGRTVVIEGMHRCIAIALAAREGKQLVTDFMVALADASGEELVPVGQFTKK